MSRMSRLSQLPYSGAAEIASDQRGSSALPPRLGVQHESIRVTNLDDASPVLLGQDLDRGITTLFLAKREGADAENLARFDRVLWPTQQPFEQEAGVGDILWRLRSADDPARFI